MKLIYLVIIFLGNYIFKAITPILHKQLAKINNNLSKNIQNNPILIMIHNKNIKLGHFIINFVGSLIQFFSKLWIFLYLYDVVGFEKNIIGQNGKKN